MSDRIVILLVFGLIGLVFGLVGLWLVISDRDFKRRAVRTQGTIVALRPQRSRNSGGVTYVPRLRFTTAYGRQIEAETNVGTNPPIGPVGHVVNVLYDPTNPVKVRVDSFWGGGNMIGVILLGFGVVFLGVSVLAGLPAL